MLNQCQLLKMRASVAYWNTKSQGTLFHHASIFLRPAYSLLLIQQQYRIGIGYRQIHKAQASVSVSGLKKSDRCIVNQDGELHKEALQPAAEQQRAGSSGLPAMVEQEKLPISALPVTALYY